MTIPAHMQAMRLHRIGRIEDGSDPLRPETIPVPEPGPGEVLVRTIACGVCHTELDEIEGRTEPPRLPVTPGHQATGEVVSEGPGCRLQHLGKQVGVAWIGGACGECRFCTTGRENLCPGFVATGRDRNGGYAEYMVADERFVHPLPANMNPVSAAPLLCAGAVGYRALRMCELQDDHALGLTGFGASGRLVLGMARHLHPGVRTAVFARSDADREEASRLGADWAGDTEDVAPFELDAIIDTTPAWKPVRCALANLAPGGRLVINAIRKENEDRDELLKLRYETHLWREKCLRSVANVTREDVRACLDLAAAMRLCPDVRTWPLAQANAALQAIRRGSGGGPQVLTMPGSG